MNTSHEVNCPQYYLDKEVVACLCGDDISQRTFIDERVCAYDKLRELKADLGVRRHALEMAIAGGEGTPYDVDSVLQLSDRVRFRERAIEKQEGSLIREYGWDEYGKGPTMSGLFVFNEECAERDRRKRQKPPTPSVPTT